MDQDTLDKKALEKFDKFVKDNNISLQVTKPLFTLNENGQLQLIEAPRILVGSRKQAKDDVVTPEVKLN